MKKSLQLIVVLAALLTSCFTASAQFRVGLRAGMNINELKFNKNVVESSNRTGFTGGVAAEFTAPIIGVGVNAAVMYSNRSFEVAYPSYDFTSSYANGSVNHKSYNRNYITIPVNFIYKISIPVVAKVIKPYVVTGPDFSFLLSKKNIEGAFKNRTFDTAWDFGLGVELFSHLQVGASYALGLTKSASGDDAMYSAKNRCWTVTATWFF